MIEQDPAIYDASKRNRAQRELSRFPVLRDQVRCSTGFTYAPGGALRHFPEKKRASHPPASSEPEA